MRSLLYLSDHKVLILYWTSLLHFKLYSRPILTSIPEQDSSLTDILVRKPSSSSTHTTVSPKVLLELFSMYREWQEQKAQQIGKKQEDIENKIEVADALATKLLQRFNFSVTAMKTTSQHLSEVHALQVQIGELKGRLTEVISNFDTLCKRISTEGPESLRSSVEPFRNAIADSDSSLLLDTKRNLLSNETKKD
ncbi:uncharacterized protein LOC126676923 isoform X2 [Mercurialis annua]|uniref:uncharacterized protein LOC126676923 isoform X2 n=1 Tax=Mercurialis annua TaxID=3986 RepID=UPI00215F4D5E|nr:uncharacterized protein LOC126676923 isoform X2 [Mercurialis annua]